MDFWHFVKKPSWHREFHVQQAKHASNSYSSLLSCFTCANLFTAFCGTANFKLSDVPNNFWNPLCLYVLENFMFRKVRNHTPNQGNWLVAQWCSVRMTHQGTCKGWSFSVIVRSKSIKFSAHQWSTALTQLVWMLVCQRKGKNGFQIGTRHITPYSPFGCFLDRYSIPKILLQIYIQSKC